MLKLTTDKQTNKQTDKQTNRQDKNNMPPTIRYGGIKKILQDHEQFGVRKDDGELAEEGEHRTGEQRKASS